VPQGFENFVPFSCRKQPLSLSGEDLRNSSKRRGNHRDVHVKTDTEANKLIWSRYFGSTTLSYSREVSSAGSRSPASANIDPARPTRGRLFADEMRLTCYDVPTRQ